MTSVVVVGGGPAGMSAAATLAEHGLMPVLIDEAPRVGGQAWRQPGPAQALNFQHLLAKDAVHWRQAHDTYGAFAGARIEHRAATLAWGIAEGAVQTQSPAGYAPIGYDAVILATGAVDRTIPVPGWTLPGVFTLGGAQTLLKEQGLAIGQRVVFCGSSPLLYLAALQYVRSGAGAVAVLDTTPFRNKVAALPRLTSALPILQRGLGYLYALRHAGVPIRHGVRDLQIEGEGEVRGVCFKDSRTRSKNIPCDAVAIGFGLRPETQLAELAGCALRYSPSFGSWQIATDADGRCGPGIYAAGDGSSLGGVEAAAISGRLAAYAAMADLGHPPRAEDAASLRRRLSRLRRFQRGLARAFRAPADWVSAAPDALTLCRCESVTVGEVRTELRRTLGVPEVNRAKALTRCGMGRCQGRFCSTALEQVVAATLDCPPDRVGQLRPQPPIKPLPLMPQTSLPRLIAGYRPLQRKAG